MLTKKEQEVINAYPESNDGILKLAHNLNIKVYFDRTDKENIAYSKIDEKSRKIVLNDEKLTNPEVRSFVISYLLADYILAGSNEEIYTTFEDVAHGDKYELAAELYAVASENTRNARKINERKRLVKTII